MIVSEPESIPTRQSLLARLKDWENQDDWRDFFDTYWRLIHRAALKASLTDAEAQDVVQEVMIAAALDLPAMDGHPHAQLAERAPVLAMEIDLRPRRGLDGVGRLVECRVHGVADRLEHDAAVRGDRVPHDPVVAEESGRVRGGMPPQQSGAAFDVAEEERDRAGWW